MARKMASSCMAAFMASVLAFSCFASAAPALAAETPSYAAGSVVMQDGARDTAKGTLEFRRLEDFGGLSVSASLSSEPSHLGLQVESTVGGSLTATSSNNAIVAVAGTAWYGFKLEVRRYGTAKITVSDGTTSADIPIVAYPFSMAELTAAGKASYNEVRLRWTTTPGVSGYQIMRVKVDGSGDTVGSFTQVKLVEGAATSTGTVPAPWGTMYRYAVFPYVSYEGRIFVREPYMQYTKDYALPSASPKIASVTRVSGKYLSVKWTADAGARSYSVYRSTQDGRGFKKIATTTAKTFTDKSVKKGTTYYYQVHAEYPGYGTAVSGTYGQVIPKSAKAAKRKVKIGQPYGDGAYGGSNWAHSDKTFYYTKGSRLYAVSYVRGNLKVYGFNASMKRVSAKTVKLPKHQIWGGFYHGPDGNNYVAIGWNNPRESDKKTVIQVVKYSSSWKKVKTASIKGSASNGYPGIYKPFDAGSVSFDLQDKTLYLYTCRTMFTLWDGLNHQANIAFTIDTGTMKAKVGAARHVSHSFNQQVRFKDGSVYVADHGDSFERGICVAAYQSETADNALWEKVPFGFKGNHGNNYTGATMGGMEVGAANVLVCGTAQPHGYKVAGVKGFKYYKQNVYVTVTNRTTGKSSVKWLSSVSPKSKKQSVSEARMVKLGDDRFAIMYSITSDKTGKGKLYYTVVNGNGKKVLTRTYKNYEFTGSVQPVVMGGSIYWSENTKGGSASTMYRIPAL